MADLAARITARSVSIDARVSAHPLAKEAVNWAETHARIRAFAAQGLTIPGWERHVSAAETALTAALDAEDARREDFTTMYQILDQMFGSEQWTERFPIQPVPWNPRTVEVARDVQKAEDIDRWRAAFEQVIERTRGRGDDMETAAVTHERPDELDAVTSTEAPHLPKVP